MTVDGHWQRCLGTFFSCSGLERRSLLIIRLLDGASRFSSPWPAPLFCPLFSLFVILTVLALSRPFPARRLEFIGFCAHFKDFPLYSEFSFPSQLSRDFVSAFYESPRTSPVYTIPQPILAGLNFYLGCLYFLF